jgi:hypothetical protein
MARRQEPVSAEGVGEWEKAEVLKPAQFQFLESAVCINKE